MKWSEGKRKEVWQCLLNITKWEQMSKDVERYYHSPCCCCFCCYCWNDFASAVIIYHHQEEESNMKYSVMSILYYYSYHYCLCRLFHSFYPLRFFLFNVLSVHFAGKRSRCCHRIPWIFLILPYKRRYTLKS